MVEGTRTLRTRVASTTTAITRPTPIIIMNVTLDSMNPPTTTTSSSAALVMIRAERCTPTATDSTGSPVAGARYSSRIRDSVNTW